MAKSGKRPGHRRSGDKTPGGTNLSRGWRQRRDERSRFAEAKQIQITARRLTCARFVSGFRSSVRAKLRLVIMPRQNRDLHGSAPDKSETVLLIVDVINDLDFPEARQLLRYVPAMTRKLARLKARAKQAGIPVVYVNDNFGRWRSDLHSLVEHCRDGKARELVDELRPDQDDYFVLKPKHSGFFSSTLETLLRYLGARRLIITGIAGNYCVLFTANDAYMRDYELMVPADCTISNTAKENRDAIKLMRNYLGADTTRSNRLRFSSRRKTKTR